MKTPEYAPEGETKCAISKSHLAPLIVEWPSTERAKLESLARGGLVAVEYSGCRMKTLAACKLKAKYRYVALTPKHDRLRMRTSDELYAAMPVYAASFEGKLKQAGELSVVMTIVGRFESDQARFDRGDLEGDCAEATHVVTGITSGSFQFAAGADAEVKGGVAFAGAGAGGKSTAARETLAQDGDESACASSSEGATAPPFGCGAFLRLEVTPIAAGARVQSPPPSPSPATPAPSPSPPTPAVARPTENPRVTEVASSARYSASPEIVVDSKTKLTWQRKPDPSGVAWADAGAFCSGLTTAGGGWRLPTKEELVGLGENLPAGIDRNAFPAITDHERNPVEASVVFYWSSTPHPQVSTMAWGVRFAVMGAQGVLQSRSSRNLVRCVRK